MMNRGDLLTVALPGDYGKPRPALVIQSDLMHRLQSVTLLPLTSERTDNADDFRVKIQPTISNGLREISYVMVDKAGTIKRAKAGPVIGHISDGEMAAVMRAFAVFCGFA
jgi:mRNA interferase MazF